MNIQWYPGHMTKARRTMQEDIKLIDIVIELVDARAPLSSKNPDIDDLAKNKFRLILLNKVDMADDQYTQAWENYFKDMGFFTARINAKTGAGMKQLTPLIQEVCREKLDRDKKRGILNRPIRAMIVGIPNVGKSTFINSFTKRTVTKVGNRPGVTKGKQWIRLNKSVELLDTPGILWPKFEDQQVGIRLAMIGSIREEILNTGELALRIIDFMKTNYRQLFENRYGIVMQDKAADTLAQLAIARNCKLKGDALDYDKASMLLLEEFRNAKIGRITLERPDL
ncbi:MAG: ribosome biogenesis GTPase YlqF [Lachnospiraceae bacterium]|nr:ribosome biogenesis GTPase YlqF [Lachnospiraceae bacterium]